MATEIERKFRVVAMESVALPPGIPIDQGYLSSEEPTVRVRTKGEHAFLTLKFMDENPADGEAIRHAEFEYEIPMEDARELLARAKARLTKTRHVFANGVELDVFHGQLTGFIMAEFESPDGAQPPAIAGITWREVTNDRRYSNSWMARNGIPTD